MSGILLGMVSILRVQNLVEQPDRETLKGNRRARWEMEVCAGYGRDTQEVSGQFRLGWRDTGWLFRKDCP